MSDTKLTAEESCRQVLKTIADACDQESLARAGGYLFRYVQEETVLRDCGQHVVCRTPPGCMRHWEERNRELVRENEVLRSNSDHLSSENASLARTERHTIHLPVFRYRDQAGNPTCAADFEIGDVCKFYRTQRMGCGETCVFAETPEGSRYAQSMDRRDGVQGPGMGTLIPGDWCPVWEPTKAKRPE